MSPLSDNETNSAWWRPYHQARLDFASLDAVSDAPPVVSAPQSEESIVSKDCWKTVALEVKATVVAPAHWNGRDWLLFSGITAGIVGVGVPVRQKPFLDAPRTPC